MKLSNLVKLSKMLWVFATVFMSLAWIKTTTLIFRNVHYVMEDKFMYIGTLGGWLFVQMFYLGIIIAFGYLMQKVINIIFASVATGDEVEE